MNDNPERSRICSHAFSLYQCVERNILSAIGLRTNFAEPMPVPAGFVVT